MNREIDKCNAQSIERSIMVYKVKQTIELNERMMKNERMENKSNIAKRDNNGQQK